MDPNKVFYPQDLSVEAERVLEAVNTELELQDLPSITIDHPNFTDKFCQLIANAWFGSSMCCGELWEDEDTMDEDYRGVIYNLFVEDKAHHKMNDNIADLMGLLSQPYDPLKDPNHFGRAL